jgi:hypothetical protein
MSPLCTFRILQRSSTYTLALISVCSPQIPSFRRDRAKNAPVTTSQRSISALWVAHIAPKSEKSASHWPLVRRSGF